MSSEATQSTTAEPVFVTLQQAADQLGVHYMTAYRYVKLGLLHAEKRGGSWMIDVDDLAAFEATGADRAKHATPSGGKSSPHTVEDALVAGDEVAAWDLLEEAAASAEDPIDVHLDVLAPALASIGRRWASGELTIATEHKASAVATRIIGRLGTRLTTPGRRRGIVVIGAAPGDVHSIPTAIFSDMLRTCGVNVVDLGGSPRIESFLEALDRHHDAVVAISITGPGHELAARSTVDALRAASPDVPIAVGGGAVRDDEHARSLGADIWHSDPRVAARLVADAAAARQVSARSATGTA